MKISVKDLVSQAFLDDPVGLSPLFLLLPHVRDHLLNHLPLLHLQQNCVNVWKPPYKLCVVTINVKSLTLMPYEINS